MDTHRPGWCKHCWPLLFQQSFLPLSVQKWVSQVRMLDVVGLFLQFCTILVLQLKYSDSGEPTRIWQIMALTRIELFLSPWNAEHSREVPSLGKWRGLATHSDLVHPSFLKKICPSKTRNPANPVQWDGRSLLETRTLWFILPRDIYTSVYQRPSLYWTLHSLEQTSFPWGLIAYKQTNIEFGQHDTMYMIQWPQAVMKQVRQYCSLETTWAERTTLEPIIHPQMFGESDLMNLTGRTKLSLPVMWERKRERGRERERERARTTPQTHWRSCRSARHRWLRNTK